MRLLFRLIPAVLLVVPAVLPAQAPAVPTPASVFGFEPGADLKLANYDQVVSYFQKVDAASDRVTMVEAGKSTQGRSFYFALVSSPQNLARIDRYREIARTLARPGSLSEAEAKRLAQEGKAFVHIDGGLHSSEVAGPQHTPLLLYDILRRASEPEIAAMLDNVILMLWPTINPDGHQMVADWYMSHVGTPDASAPMPNLYQEYVGHDNNRDAYMLNMIESRVMEHTWRQWEPSIIYVHHQSAPFPTRIWLPPFAEPIAQHAPYLMSRELNMIGMAIAQRLEEEGKVGATHMGTGYDAWYPGYIDYMPVFKNIPAFWTETQGNGAAPRETNPETIAPNMRRPQALYASPWLGGTWRLRDAVDYMETASLATLDYASKYKSSILYNRYLSARQQIARGRSEAPYAYVVPQEQRDPVAAVEMLRRLAFNGVRVSQLSAPATLEGTTFPAGTWVVPADQEFAAVAREVLDVQKYPEIRESPNGPLDTPYDAAGWTLPLAMGVRTVIATSPLADDVRSKLRPMAPLPAANAAPAPYNLTASADAAAFDSAPGLGFDSDPSARAIVPPAGRIAGTGPVLAVNPAENNAFKAVNRAWKAGGSASYRPASSAAGARYVIAGLSPSAQADLVKALALNAEHAAAPPAAGAKPQRPRIGLFLANTSMDEGWTRWVLDRYEFEYTRVSGADIQAGSLRDKIDVLVLADDARVLETSGRGRGAGGGAPGGGGAAAGAAGAGAAGAGAAGAGGAGAGAAGAGAAGAGAAGQGGGSFRPGQGVSTPVDLTAGNEARVRAIDEFVRAGGTLVCFNRSSSFAVDQLKLPVKNVVTGLQRTQFFVGGSLLNVTVDVSHRVMAGMPERAAVYYDSGPVFETLEGFRGTILAKYPDNESPLASGFLQGEKYIQGKAAAVDVELGAGHVILLGFRPQWRGQPFGTFRVIFNAVNMGR